MKIPVFAAALLLAGAALSACDNGGLCIRGEGDVETREIQLDAFHGIDVNGSTKVYIARGPVQHVKVKGEPNILDELETDIDDGTWQIEFDRCLGKHKAVEVYITMPDMDYAEVSGSGLLQMDDTFEAADFQARVSGSGKINGQITVGKLTSRISGSGSISLAGTAVNHDIAISGSGSINAFELDTRNTEVGVSGSGSAEVTVADALDVDISGSGRVYYQGNPAVNTHISGSGKVIKR